MPDRRLRSPSPWLGAGLGEGGGTGLASTATGALGYPGRSEVCQLKVNETSLKDETGSIIPGSLELWVRVPGTSLKLSAVPRFC